MKIWKTKISIKSYILLLLVGFQLAGVALEALFKLVCAHLPRPNEVYQVFTSYGNFVQVFFLTYVAHNIPTARFVLP